MNKKEVFKTAINLVIFCFVVGFLLSFYNSITKDKIAENIRLETESVQKKLLDADEYKTLEGLPGDISVVKAVKDGKFTGYIVTTTATGYSSRIKIMYSVSPDYKIMGVSIVSQQETPGLGTKIEENVPITQFGDKPFLAQFDGKNIDALKIGNDKSFNPNSIAAISGATISSTAVTKGVHDSLKHLIEGLENKGAGSKTPPSEEQSAKTTGLLERLLKGSTVYACNNCSGKSPEDYFKNADLKPVAVESKNVKVVRASKDKKTLGYVITSQAEGYKPGLTVSFAIDPSGRIIDVMIMENNETKVYLDRLIKERFTMRFRGLTYNEARLKADGGKIDAVTGCTDSSKGIVAAVRKGLDVFNKEVKK